MYLCESCSTVGPLVDIHSGLRQWGGQLGCVFPGVVDVYSM